MLVFPNSQSLFTTWDTSQAILQTGTPVIVLSSAYSLSVFPPHIIIHLTMASKHVERRDSEDVHDISIGSSLTTTVCQIDE